MHKISHFLRYPRTSEKRTTYSLLPPISHPIESRVRSLPFRFARREEEVDVGRDEGAEVRGRRAAVAAATRRDEKFARLTYRCVGTVRRTFPVNSIFTAARTRETFSPNGLRLDSKEP